MHEDGDDPWLEAMLPICEERLPGLGGRESEVLVETKGLLGFGLK